MKRISNTQFERGQGMVEYIIIVAMIALAAIGAFTYFGDAIRGQTAQMAAQVAGQDNTDGSDAAATASDNATTEATTDYSLDNFDQADAQ